MTDRPAKVRTRLYSDGEIITEADIQQRRHSSGINGKEIIIRTNYNGALHDLPASRAATLTRRSLRRRIKEPKPKYYRLEPGDATYDLKPHSKSVSSATSTAVVVAIPPGKVATQRRKSASLSMGEIFSSVKRGMSAFSVPKFASKSSAHHKPMKIKDSSAADGDASNTADRWSVRNGSILSASSTDLRALHPLGSGSSENGERSSPEQGRNGTNHNNNNNKTPGITGIRNHGNTCYMNAVLQCLCHTDNLAKYFVFDQYKMDLSRRNKNNAKKYGTKGEVTEQLAVVFKSLWSSQYTPEISNQFRNVVGKYESQYQGGNQQDAQEFLLWLLDKVHEDLNTATKKKYKKVGSNMGRPDEIVAAEALANHMRCNNSFVHDLFQAQYRSSLTCPICQRQSTTFDPFLCISTPIPQRPHRPLFATVVYLNQQPKEVKLGLCLNAHSTIGELRKVLSVDSGIPEDQMILIEMHQDNFGRTFKDSDRINTIQDTDVVYAIEVPPMKQSDASAGEHVLLLWVNKLGIGTSAKRFGGPYALQVHRESSYSQLQRAVLKAMAGILKDRGVIEKDLDPFLRLRVVDGIPGKCYLPDDVEHPLYMPTVDEALSNAIANGRGPMHLKISVEWDLEIRDLYIQNPEEIVEEHHSVKDVHNQRNKMAAATLSDCFNLYTQEERLGPEDPWLCPSCKRPQQGVKKLSLWSLPDILVIHLKRFSQMSTQRTKLDTLIDFPIHDLDMSPHIVHRSHMNHMNSNGNGVLGYWSPWKPPQRHFHRSDNTYELYGICNHHGSMQSGHYTAYCRNPTDGLWYHFDDTTVKKVEESQIVTGSAYILFYQRRSLSPGCSSSESSSCGDPDHWAYRMPNFQYLLPKASKSHDNLCDLDYRVSNNGLSKERSFLRGTRKYSSMVHLSPHRRNSPKPEIPIVERNGHCEEETLSQGYMIPESSV